MKSNRRKEVFKYVIPTMLSSICMFLFTIIDGIFVGKGVGTDALGAVNIAFPMVMVVNALYMLTTIGGVTVVAIRLGRKDYKGANNMFMHSVISTLAIGLFFTILGLLFSKQISVLFGANDTFLKYASDYIFWYSAFTIPAGLTICLQSLCRNDGSPFISSIAVVISSICNIFLDWLFIFPLKMGTAGAAIATGISQTISLAIVSIHYLSKKGKLYFHIPKLDKGLFKKIILRGAPESIAQFASPIMTICFNQVLINKIGNIGINAFAVISYVVAFSIAIFFGTGDGLQPLLGQSYGAKEEKDLKYYYHAGLIINIIGSILVYIFMILLCKPISSLFGANTETINYIVKCMPKYAWGFIAMSINVMISAYLYSTKRSKYAIIINILRSFIVSALIILLLPTVFGSNIIWFTFGMYEVIIVIIAIILTKYSEKNGIIFE